MKRLQSTSHKFFAGLFLLAALSDPAESQVLTIQVGAPAPPPTPLVNHGDTWRYRPGVNNAPQADWKTADDTALDGTWTAAPGGFGYGDPGIVGEATTLSTMMNNYSSLFIRRSFSIAAPVDPSRHIQLTVDYDDGYVAYLDGTEIARSPNVIGPPAYNASTVTANHEASCCNPPTNPPTVLDLGLVGSSLAVGSHVFALQGINSGSNSSDFHLIADLRLVGGASVAGGGPLFAIVSAASTLLSGTNTIPGSSRVSVNGEEAAYNPATGEWSLNKALSPGLNNLFIAALDSTGAILASISRDVLYETTPITVGGVLSGANVWDGASGTYHITSTVLVPNGASLRLTNGAVVLLAPGTAIRATTNGVVTADGTESKPILFAPSDGTGPFADLGAFGTNASLTLRHAEIVAGQIRPVNGGTVLMEDTTIRDLSVPGTEVIAGVNGGSLTVRRCYGARFGEMDSSETPVLIEDSLLEYFAVDGLDIKGTNVPLVVRRSTIRFGDPTNGNADGLDFGPGPGTVERCLIHDFPDKGISLGGAPGTRARDTLIYNCGSGINVNNSTNCHIDNVTISACATGLFFRTSGPNLSDLSGTNNIVWGNTVNVYFTGNSALQLAYSDVQGGQPGIGNINADPLFVDAQAKDFRLSPGSPAIGAGLGGTDMGAATDLDGGVIRVGGLPAAPRNLAALITGTNVIRLVWQDDSDNEVAFELERRIGVNGPWSLYANFWSGETNGTDPNVELDVRYFYRLRAVNGSGKSRFSNIASAIWQEPNVFVGGTLTADATWSPALGTVTVVSNLIVPAGVTLTMLPGTMVKVTNDVSIIAVGGVINIAGTADHKVQLMPLVGANLWGQLSAQFGGSLTVRHADISYAQTTVYSNAVGLLEDSFFHDYRRANGDLFTAPIILTHFAAPTTVRRCHVREYHETLWRNGILLIEECLFENVHGDAVDFDSAQTGTVIRNCTFRHGAFGNVDAVDVGPGDIAGSFDVRVENCMMYDFPFDKGVSVGDRGSSFGTIVSNCFIYSCLSGVMAKDRCDVSVRNCTIVSNSWGFTNYNKVNPASPTGGGITTNSYNNILWNNGITISMVNDSQLFADHNDFGNTNWPGPGNIDVNPLFLNPGGRDYRLAANSPCRGAGRDGADMGALFPVGAPMVLSHPRIESFATAGGNSVVRFWADNEKTYSVLCSAAVEGGSWIRLADVPTGMVPRFLSVTNAIAPGNRFYRLVTPALP